MNMMFLYSILNLFSCWFPLRIPIHVWCIKIRISYIVDPQVILPTIYFRTSTRLFSIFQSSCDYQMCILNMRVVIDIFNLELITPPFEIWNFVLNVFFKLFSFMRNHFPNRYMEWTPQKKNFGNICVGKLFNWNNIQSSLFFEGFLKNLTPSPTPLFFEAFKT